MVIKFGNDFECFIVNAVSLVYYVSGHHYCQIIWEYELIDL